MAENVKEVREWLEGLPDDALVGIHEDGLQLIVNGAQDRPEDDDEAEKICLAAFELGGIRIEED